MLSSSLRSIPGEKEMNYISQKHDVMEKLVTHFGYMEPEITEDIFASLVMHIIGQMLSDKAAAAIVRRLLNVVKELSPLNMLQLSPML